MNIIEVENYDEMSQNAAVFMIEIKLKNKYNLSFWEDIDWGIVAGEEINQRWH